jgi:small GTP-binding protein
MSVASNKEELRLKIVFIGPSYAGKTSLLNRVARNDFNDKYLATIGCDFLSKVYNLYGRKFRAQFWDTAGQERFGTISKIYFRGT